MSEHTIHNGPSTGEVSLRAQSGQSRKLGDGATYKPYRKPRINRRKVALFWVRHFLRGFAKERRRMAVRGGDYGWRDGYAEGSGRGGGFAALVMAEKLGALSTFDETLLRARLDRIQKAKITRGRTA